MGVAITSITREGTLHPAPEFRHYDGGDFKPIVWQRCDLTPQIDTFFLANDDVGIADDPFFGRGFEALTRHLELTTQCSGRLVPANSVLARALAGSRPSRLLLRPVPSAQTEKTSSRLFGSFEDANFRNWRRRERQDSFY